jgi:hypothetical protein
MDSAQALMDEPGPILRGPDHRRTQSAVAEALASGNLDFLSEGVRGYGTPRKRLI